MKIEFNLDDKLPINKVIEIAGKVIVVGAIFKKITNIDHTFFLDKCLYII